MEIDLAAFALVLLIGALGSFGCGCGCGCDTGNNSMLSEVSVLCALLLSPFIVAYRALDILTSFSSAAAMVVVIMLTGVDKSGDNRDTVLYRKSRSKAMAADALRFVS